MGNEKSEGFSYSFKITTVAKSGHETGLQRIVTLTDTSPEILKTPESHRRDKQHQYYKKTYLFRAHSSRCRHDFNPKFGHLSG